VQLTDRQVALIEEFALKKYRSLDDTHGADHCEKTASIASYLARKEGADEIIAKMGALLHQFHLEGAAQVNEFLPSIDVSPHMSDRIAHCVRCIEPTTIHTARTIEAKAVFDADKLQILGPYGLVREVVYRTRTKNVDFRVAFREAEELQKEMAVLLQTATAKALYEKMKALSISMFDAIREWDALEFVSQ
jgi:HD superfamily phosphodiesterase